MYHEGYRDGQVYLADFVLFSHSNHFYLLLSSLQPVFLVLFNEIFIFIFCAFLPVRPPYGGLTTFASN
jgi:hypothetical protein